MGRLSVAGAAAAVLMAAALPAGAQSGRYTMVPAADGVLRLDTQTGGLSHCTAKGAGWVCKSVADDRLALQGEIDRLSLENDRLWRELEGLRAGLASPPPEAAPPAPDATTGTLPEETPETVPEDRAQAEPKEGQETVPAPHNKDVDKLMALFERMARRFQDMVETFKQQYQQGQPQQRL